MNLCLTVRVLRIQRRAYGTSLELCRHFSVSSGLEFLTCPMSYSKIFKTTVIAHRVVESHGAVKVTCYSHFPAERCIRVISNGKYYLVRP